MKAINLLYWLIDYTYLARGKAVMYLHRKPPKHYLGYIVDNKNPVIIIQGITDKWGFLKKVADKISLDGHPVYVVPSLGHNYIGIEQSAKIVKKIIDDNKLDNVLIIGHSKGGLIGKYLLVNYNRDKRIKGVIAVATPFSGSSYVRILPFKAFKELRPRSEIISSLNRNTAVNAKIISIFPIFDNHVHSKNKSLLKGATNIELNIKGHHKIIFSKDLLNQIFQSIEILSGI